VPFLVLKGGRPNFGEQEKGPHRLNGRRGLLRYFRRMRLIRFRGHLPKGGYDVPNGQHDAKPAAAPAV
jgi:hypothetical protein